MPAQAARPTQPTSWSDAELLRRTIAREERAWSELVRRYGPLLIRRIAHVTSRYAPHLGRSEVDEIYAEVLLKLYRDDMRRLRRFDPTRGTKLSSWLGTIATRSAYDALRSASRRPLACAEDGALDPEHDLTPLSALLEKERWDCFGDLFAELTARDRRFLELYFDEGLPAPAIAGAMSINLKTVYTKKHKIRAHLQRALASRSADFPLADLEGAAA